jgi:hypothetical protein
MSAGEKVGADCSNCDGSGWVCENHPDRPWEHLAAPGEGCGCGAGQPCGVCNLQMASAGFVEPWRKLANDLADCLAETRDRLAGVVSQFDHAGCTCTVPSDDCCSYAAADAAISRADALLSTRTGSAEQ